MFDLHFSSEANKLAQTQNLAASVDSMSILRPPICRSANAILDRALFSKTVPIAAARISNLKNISKYKAKFEQSKELIRLEKITNVQPDPDPSFASKGGKCLLLSADVKPEGMCGYSLENKKNAKRIQIQKHGALSCKKLLQRRRLELFLSI